MKNIPKRVAHPSGLPSLRSLQRLAKPRAILNALPLLRTRSRNRIEHALGIPLLLDLEQSLVVAAPEMLLPIVLVWIGLVDVGATVLTKLAKWLIDGIGEKVLEI